MNHQQFRTLFDHCQTLTPKISRNAIINKIKEITGVEKIRTIKVTLDTTVTRGFFLRATNVEHELVKATGFNVVAIARGLNDCWERFVNVKEAMHLFDDDGDLVDTAEKFEQLLNDFSSPTLTTSPQTASDLLGIWMALACLCPEKSRLEFEALVAKGQIDNYGIALRLKIPKYYVPLLFRPGNLAAPYRLAEAS